MEIRETLESEWETIYPIFRAVVDAGTTYAYPSGLSSDEARALWMEGPPGRTLLAIEDGDVLGTASFMVTPEFQGRGVGRALGEYVIERARRDGYRAMQFNAVVASNLAAVHLWQQLGFTILATVPEAYDHKVDGFVGLHVMYRKL
jgi:GNAT superfamily N-acetyltransferase